MTLLILIGGVWAAMSIGFALGWGLRGALGRSF